ncbi:PIR Superfamily Protein [Plasmodium ovale wallikeri]|uniref:PIR Superfamily Protein n=1 Tax=Plasmodium ovale wallikeri TaxID=864142 RepID=A0A1A9AJN6_PLAOA|nr:PIR Superfamily Protein [Plasmodium ovale wallikeri]SBT56832.1 PIR Superfamily Protein [Plasmodium ovale wallikeri]
MSCYEFFKCIDKYMIHEDLAEEKGISESSGVDCSFINDIVSDKNHELIEVCKKFVYLAESINNKNICTTYDDNNDFDYLNYWLNKQIYKIETSNTCSKFFYQNLRSKNNEKTYLRNFSSNMYDIEENELKDMNILYTLYKYFKEIKEIINNGNSYKEDIIDHANKCVVEYKKFNQKCTEYKTNFCKALKIFKDKYEEINLCDFKLDKWKNEKLPSLTAEGNALVKECTPSVKRVEEAVLEDQETIIGSVADPSHIDTKTITISVVATSGISFIFFILYKFTSFGQFLNYRMNNDENVWENMDEKMNNSSYTSDYEHINSEKTTYNIEYNSA